MLTRQGIFFIRILKLYNIYIFVSMQYSRIYVKIGRIKVFPLFDWERANPLILLCIPIKIDYATIVICMFLKIDPLSIV